MQIKKQSIFINYRRKLSTSSANLLYLMLEQRFPDQVFIDGDLKGGDRWNPEIEDRLGKAKVVIALIPPNWLFYPTEKDKVSSLEDIQAYCKLHKADRCHVRKELEIALEAGITIIPVLLNGAEEPLRDWLPATLQPLPDRYNYTSLDFTNPNRTAFRYFFDNVAEKAGLSQKNVAENGDLFYRPVNKSFPLPEESEQLEADAGSPYVGLKPFGEKDARLFFGRSREIYDWCHRIIYEDDQRLLLLDGYSGTGKSSLLQAGIIPRIKARVWGVVYGRREEDKINGLPGTLQKLTHRLKEQGKAKGLLILDQVEEAITNPIDIKPRELKDMAEELVIILQQYSDWKIILGFRSEYMARLAKVLKEVGLSFSSDHTLYPLDRNGIMEAVRSVSVLPKLREKHYPLYFVPDSLPEVIADRLLEGRAGYQIAPLIQVNMELLWQQCRQGNRVQITSNAIKNFIEDKEALLDYYLRKIRENITEGYADDLAILELLSFYIEEKPSAATRLDQEFQNHEKFSQDSRSITLHGALESRYLLSSVGDGAERATRLAHDMLAEVIYKRFAQLNISVRQDSQHREFDLLLEKLQDQLDRLKYQEAQKHLEELMTIGIRREELKPFLFEMLFFWNETGRLENLKQCLQFWQDSNLLSESAQEPLKVITSNKNDVRDWLRKLEEGRYQDLRIRYFAPINTCMITVKGGILNSERGTEIKINTFRMANIQTTFRKYGLFLYAIGQEKRLEEMDPGWGIQASGPVVKVNWYDAIEYCNWLSEVQGLEKVYTIDKYRKNPHVENQYDDIKWVVAACHKANGYRIPTDPEWEFAARGGHGGKSFLYSGSNDLDEVGWYSENSDGKTHPVAQKRPNDLGLYDMSGNVREWCWDWYYDHPVETTTGLKKRNYRVFLRGGSWRDNDAKCRLVYRSYDPSNRDVNNGFRLAQGLPAAL